MTTIQDKIRAAGHHRKHWGRVIIRAANSGKGFGVSERLAANDWAKCVCGMLPARLPRFTEADAPDIDSDHAPIDKLLRRWGFQFCDAVCDDDVRLAGELFLKIHKRAAKLLEGE